MGIYAVCLNLNKIFSRRQHGYSLIEVVIAMAILSVGILAIAKMQIWATKNNATGNMTTQAIMLAEAHLENLKNISDISLLTDSSESGIDQNGNPGGIFSRKTRVTNPWGGNFSRQIVVTVNWNKNGLKRKVILHSLTQGGGI